MKNTIIYFCRNIAIPTSTNYLKERPQNDAGNSTTVSNRIVCSIILWSAQQQLTLTFRVHCTVVYSREHYHQILVYCSRNHLHLDILPLKSHKTGIAFTSRHVWYIFPRITHYRYNNAHITNFPYLFCQSPPSWNMFPKITHSGNKSLQIIDFAHSPFFLNCRKCLNCCTRTV